MCWSFEASVTLAFIGFFIAIYKAIKKQPLPLTISIGYFSLMETLQAVTYTVIDKCDSPLNQICTILGYIHIVFQPFFINAASLYFIPTRISKKIYLIVYTLCGISTIVMLLSLYPFDKNWAGECKIQSAICSKVLCSMYGNWHIAWHIPLNGIISDKISPYLIVGFALPILYGSYRFTLVHILVGPLLSYLLTDNPNERPAVWCLLSIFIASITVLPWLQKFFHVKNWFWWKLIKDSDKIS